MASNIPSSICFFMKNNNFEVYDLLPKLAIQDVDAPNLIYESSAPDVKFINCKYAEVRCPGNVSLDACIVGKVNAVGNAILFNSSITDISANEVAILGNFKGKTVKANRVYTNQVLSDVSIDGHLDRIILGILPTDRIRMLLHSGAKILGCFLLSKNIATVEVDGGFIGKDVVFPEDSVIPESERQVILTNGGRLGGTVIRGKLADQNKPEESDFVEIEIDDDLDVQSLSDNESVVESCS